MVLVMGLCICGNYLQETNLALCIISKVCINDSYLNSVGSRTSYKTIPEAALHLLRFFAVKLMFFLHNVLMFQVAVFPVLLPMIRGRAQALWP